MLKCTCFSQGLTRMWINGICKCARTRPFISVSVHVAFPKVCILSGEHLNCGRSTTGKRFIEVSSQSVFRLVATQTNAVILSKHLLIATSIPATHTHTRARPAVSAGNFNWASTAEDQSEACLKCTSNVICVICKFVCFVMTGGSGCSCVLRMN